MKKIEGSIMDDNGYVTLGGRILCPRAQKVISSTNCGEFCCGYFEAKRIKKGGLLEVWCSYTERRQT